jgi:hypothetical protein
MASEMLESERRLLATDRRQQGNSGVDHRDNEAHLAAVRDKGSASAHEPRRVPYPSAVGGLRPLVDKVGGSK